MSESKLTRNQLPQRRPLPNNNLVLLIISNLVRDNRDNPEKRVKKVVSAVLEVATEVVAAATEAAEVATEVAMKVSREKAAIEAAMKVNKEKVAIEAATEVVTMVATKVKKERTTTEVPTEAVAVVTEAAEVVWNTDQRPLVEMPLLMMVLLFTSKRNTNTQLTKVTVTIDSMVSTEKITTHTTDMTVLAEVTRLSRELPTTRSQSTKSRVIQIQKSSKRLKRNPKDKDRIEVQEEVAIDTQETTTEDRVEVANTNTKSNQRLMTLNKQLKIKTKSL